MIIIGFGHKAQNGKDTAGEAILNYYAAQASASFKHGVKYAGPRIALMKFASALYDECRKLHGMKEKDPVLLQNVGMARREEDPDYWVKRAFAAIPQGTNLAIFTDVRFHNEAKRIKAEGGHLIEVVRLNQDGTRYYATDRPSDHISETSLDGYNWDFKIHSKSAALTAELAITICEFVRGLETK
jgi:hypothetical protein